MRAIGIACLGAAVAGVAAGHVVFVIFFWPAFVGIFFGLCFSLWNRRR